MKRCTKCGKDYPDLDNFCITCGNKLVQSKLLTETSKEQRHIHNRIDNIEKRVNVLPQKPQYVHTLRKRLDTFERKMGDTTSILKSSIKDVDKKAERLGQFKFIPKQDALSIVRELSLLDRKIADLNASIKGLRIDMPRAEHILGEIEQRLIETKGTLFTKQQHQLEEMSNRISMLESRIEGSEKDIEEGMDKMKNISGGTNFAKFLSTVNENKANIAQLQEMKKEFDEIKKRSASFNAQKIKDNILTDFEKINNNLLESVEQKKTEIQRIEQETAKMREGIQSLKGLEEKVKGVNAEGISRDLEILKTKTKWLEDQIESIDIKPLHERLQDLELDLKRITSSSPMIVE